MFSAAFCGLEEEHAVLVDCSARQVRRCFQRLLVVVDVQIQCEKNWSFRDMLRNPANMTAGLGNPNGREKPQVRVAQKLGCHEIAGTCPPPI